MQKFDVYPKEGAKFTVEMAGFEVQGDKFVLADQAGKASSEGFLSKDQVAAIVPQTPKGKNTITFNVHLKGQDEPIQVNASAFDMSGGESVKFKHQQYDLFGKVANEWPMENIYIATSEVVAIIPTDGLVYRER